MDHTLKLTLTFCSANVEILSISANLLQNCPSPIAPCASSPFQQNSLKELTILSSSTFSITSLYHVFQEDLPVTTMPKSSPKVLYTTQFNGQWTVSDSLATSVIIKSDRNHFEEL